MAHDYSERVFGERQHLAVEDPDGEAEAVIPLGPDGKLQPLADLVASGEWDRPRAVRLGSISTDPPPPLLVGRLDPEGHTILYGPGGVGKGALSCWWIVQLVAAGQRVMLVDFEGHAAEWARRIASLDASAVERVWYIAPTKPLRAIALDVRSECERLHVTYVVVDSAVMACGDDPLKTEAARNYAEGLVRLGRPALTLAHVTKLDDGKYPFGSVFWHNLARTTWSLIPDATNPVLTHRKHNNYAPMARQSVEMTWRDGQLREVWERSYAATLADEIAEILGESPGLTVKAIIEALSGPDRAVPRDSVKSALKRGTGGPMGRFTCTQGPSGQVWSLRA